MEDTKSTDGQAKTKKRKLNEYGKRTCLCGMGEKSDKCYGLLQ